MTRWVHLTVASILWMLAVHAWPETAGAQQSSPYRGDPYAQYMREFQRGKSGQYYRPDAYGQYLRDYQNNNRAQNGGPVRYGQAPYYRQPWRYGVPPYYAPPPLVPYPVYVPYYYYRGW